MWNKIKKFLPKSLYGRTLMILVLPTLLAQAFAVYMFYERHWGNVSRHMAESLAGEVAVLVRLAEISDKNNVAEKFLIASENLFSMQVNLIEQPQAESFITSHKKITSGMYPIKLRQNIKNKFLVFDVPEDSQIATLVWLKNGDYMLVTVSEKRLFNSSTYIFIMWMTGTTFLLLMISVMFLKNQIRPIIRLARFANNFGRGQEPPQNFKPEGALEVKQAAKSFLSMVHRIKRHMGQRTEMLAGISHDLRTPLTRMRLQLEIVKKKISKSEYEELSSDISDMEKMINSYIDFVRADEEEETKSCDINEIIADLTRKYKTQKELKIKFSQSGNAIALVRENAIRRAFENVLENSKKYASEAFVTSKTEMNYVVITIEDNGQGIAEAERENVFKPFYRIENSRNPETGGSGLGLSIVRDIINGHGGTVELGKSRRLGGLKVAIKLPQ